MDRIEVLKGLLARHPEDARAHFGLAAEFEKREDWRRVVEHLEHYLTQTQDQGNAWGRLARAYHQLGEDTAAARAYRQGIEAAYQHGHPSMAAEFEAALAELDA